MKGSPILASFILSITMFMEYILYQDKSNHKESACYRVIRQVMGVETRSFFYFQLLLLGTVAVTVPVTVAVTGNMTN